MHLQLQDNLTSDFTRSITLSSPSPAHTSSSHTNKKSTKMSREAYQVPALDNQNAFGNGAGAGGYAQPQVQSVRYICGECDAKFSLPPNATLRCTECGHRILYKERTKRFVLSLSFLAASKSFWSGGAEFRYRIVQFEAR
jgi:DNA-directed RNA polymerase I, II, and III subunit RPABC4